MNHPRFHSFGFRAMGSEDRVIQAGYAWSMFNHSSDDFHISRYITENRVGLDVTTIPTSAHKVVQNWDDEMECMKHAIDNAANVYVGAGTVFNKPVISIPIDTYSSENFIKNYVVRLKKYADHKDVGLVFRPDSGDVIHYGVQVMRALASHHIANNVSIIIGDSVTFESAKEGDKIFQKEGIGLDRIVWGIGAGYYKDFSRDYLGWAMKTAYSNHDQRMKFSDTPIKQSIPGKVEIASISPDHLKLTTCSDYDKTPAGYWSVYFHKKDIETPVMNIYGINMIRKIALDDMEAMYKRKLILDDEILETIERCRKKYLPDNSIPIPEYLQK